MGQTAQREQRAKARRARECELKWLPLFGALSVHEKAKEKMKTTESTRRAGQAFGKKLRNKICLSGFCTVGACFHTLEVLKPLRWLGSQRKQNVRGFATPTEKEQVLYHDRLVVEETNHPRA